MNNNYKDEISNVAMNSSRTQYEQRSLILLALCAMGGVMPLKKTNWWLMPSWLSATNETHLNSFSSASKWSHKWVLLIFLGIDVISGGINSTIFLLAFVSTNLLLDRKNEPRIKALKYSRTHTHIVYFFFKHVKWTQEMEVGPSVVMLDHNS